MSLLPPFSYKIARTYVLCLFLFTSSIINSLAVVINIQMVDPGMSENSSSRQRKRKKKITEEINEMSHEERLNSPSEYIKRDKHVCTLSFLVIALLPGKKLVSLKRLTYID